MVDTSITQHIAHLRLRNLQPTTADHRRGQLERLHAHLGKPLVQATPAELEKWQRSLSVSSSSIATYTSHVRAFYAWALESELIGADPSRNLVMPKIKRRMPRPIPEDDLRVALITAQHDHQLYCWLLLAAFCGLRAGEIAKICRGDLRIEPTGGGYLTVNGKGGHQRVVRVPRGVVEELRPQLRQSGPIFRRRNGQPFTPNYLSQQASKHLQGLGLSYTLHTLRHRFATVMCDMGADVRDVQQLLGHRDLATTTLYVAHSTRRASGSVDKLGEGLAAMRRRQSLTRHRKTMKEGTP
ncbi:MAG: tyrosine-type recombinase/integrase [Rhodococcus sp. (in: high G+C Gram-positive bacteria)]|uniref:tyrosine-type recombinase/integrase n=1 Tax=Rhodococcus sp. TaxID=1831 RepID=UPI003BB0F582